MSVRQTIWFWQLGEIVVYTWLVRAWFSLSIAGVTMVVIVTFLMVRLVGIALVAFVVNLRFSDARLSRVSVFLKYVLGEFFAFIALYCFWQILPKRLTFKDQSVQENHIIFVHGFLCNNGFWHFLNRQSRHLGFSTSGVELPGPFSDIEDFAAIISTEIDRVQASRANACITIVAFSMGGLASRFLLATRNVKANLITINTPHRGTVLALLSKAVGAKNGLQMCPDSNWLQNLNELEAKSEPQGIRFGAWSAHDTIVLPAWRGRPPYRNVQSLAKGHLYAAIDFRLHRQLLRLLRRIHRL